jgi:hypothetical protein
MLENFCFLLKRVKVVFFWLEIHVFTLQNIPVSKFKRKFKIGELRISQCFDFLFLQLLTRMLVCVRSPYMRCVTEERKYSRNVILLVDVHSDLEITYSSW